MKREKLSLIVLPLVVMAFSSLVQPRLGVTDCDAEAYVMGARSLRAGLGYIDLAGNHLNHWPVGYSWILSLFPIAQNAAWLINLLSLGVATLFILLLTARVGWPFWQRIALALIFGTGFFAHLSFYVKPDVLSYAVFLVGVWFYLRDGRANRIIGLVLCAFLIPIKLIAVTFAPALLFSDLVALKWRVFFRKRQWELGIGLLCWLLGLGAVLLHNHFSLHGMTPESYGSPLIGIVLGEARRFVGDFFRAGLAIWYGSIRELRILIPVALVAVLGLACVSSLRRNRAVFVPLLIGSAVLSLSWMMELYRVFYASPRLMGYGMVIMLLGYIPRKRFTAMWLIYGVAVACLTAYNQTAIVSLGINYPMYEQTAQEVAANVPGETKVVYTNTAHLLDLHANRLSKLTTNLEALPSGSIYWYADMPNLDAINQPIVKLAAPDWPQIKQFANGSLYRKP